MMGPQAVREMALLLAFALTTVLSGVTGTVVHIIGERLCDRWDCPEYVLWGALVWLIGPAFLVGLFLAHRTAWPRWGVVVIGLSSALAVGGVSYLIAVPADEPDRLAYVIAASFLGLIIGMPASWGGKLVGRRIDREREVTS